MLFVPALVHLWDIAFPLSPLWGDAYIKRSSDAVPSDWDSLGEPFAGTTNNIYTVLEQQHENVLIEVRYPGHPKHVLSTSPPRTHLHLCSCVRCSGTGIVHTIKEQVAELVALRSSSPIFDLNYSGVTPTSVSATRSLSTTGMSVSRLTISSAHHTSYTGTPRRTRSFRAVSYAVLTALPVHGYVQTVAATRCSSPCSCSGLYFTSAPAGQQWSW